MIEPRVPDGLTNALHGVGMHLAGPLGAGAGGPRWCAEDADGTRWAVTVVDVRSPEHGERLRRRVAALRAVQHEHVARLGPVLPIPEGRVAVLQQEVAGTDLAVVGAARGSWQPGEVVAVLVPLAEALAALHDVGVIHGDVAPANVVLTPGGRPVLVDLVTGDDVEERGTPGFAAPERAQGARPAGDVYALGRTGLHLLGEVGGGETGTARERVERCLRTATRAVAEERPGAAELAGGLAGTCPAVPVEQPEPAVLARLALRRLAAAAAEDRTRRLPTAPHRAGRSAPRHRRGRRRGRTLVAVCGLVLAVCGTTVVATAARDAAVPGTPSGDVVDLPGVPDPPAAAVRLTHRRAAALAHHDAAALGRVTVPGSAAAAADVEARVGLAGVAITPGTVRTVIDGVRLLPPVDASAPWLRRDCPRCVKVAVRSRAGAASGPEGDSAQGTPAVAASTAPEVVLVLRPTSAGWRVSEVASSGP